MRRKFFATAVGIIAALSNCNSAMAQRTSTHSALHLSTNLYVCDTNDNGSAVAKYVPVHGELVNSVSTYDGGGYSTTQAGLFLSGLRGGSIPGKKIYFQFLPLGSTTTGTCQGPFIYIHSLSSEHGDATILFSPTRLGGLSGPNAQGWYTVNSVNTVVPDAQMLGFGILTTNNGQFLIRNLAIDGHPIPHGSVRSAYDSCVFGTSEDFTATDYAGDGCAEN